MTDSHPRSSLVELPAWDWFMVPVLRVCADGGVRTRREIITEVSAASALTDAQLSAVLASGGTIAGDRIGWAISDLTAANALERPERARYRITDLGRALLRAHPETLTKRELRAVTGDAGSDASDRTLSVSEQASAMATLGPFELIESVVGQIHAGVKAELLDRLVDQDPAFFERAVVSLLVAMGYGGTGGEAAATRLVNDGGIDGIIDQDVLGLSKVYIQAKRYAPGNSVGRPEIQAFVGALSGKADQGVFVTTGRFTSGAREYAERDARVRVILIDGPRLVDLMVQYRVGVQVQETVHIVKVDEDFFE